MEIRKLESARTWKDPIFVGKDFQGRQSDICRLLLFYQDKRECDLCS